MDYAERFKKHLKSIMRKALNNIITRNRLLAKSACKCFWLLLHLPYVKAEI